MSRVVTWFSCGIASAVAAHLMLEKYRDTHDVQIVRCVIDTEHEDNDRFSSDISRRLNCEITNIRSTKYGDPWQVFEERRFLVGPKGALCTTELKKIPRFNFQYPDDIQAFGFTADKLDCARADQFRQQNPDVILETPLIDAGMRKVDCHALVRSWGIEAPAMYRLGYRNNNCIGCVKGGMGYWNKIRRDFPDVFDRMAKVERDIGRSICREGSGTDKRQVFLDELAPNRGTYSNEADIDCGLLCIGAQP